MHDKSEKQKDIMVDIEMIKNKYCMNNFWCVFILFVCNMVVNDF